MRCRKYSYRHTVRRAGYIVQADLVAELDRRRIAAVLAADSEFDIGSCSFALRRSYLYQFAYAFLVKLRKRIRLEYLLLVLIAQELARVVTAES